MQRQLASAVQQKSEAEVEMATVRQEYEMYKVSGLTANCVQTWPAVGREQSSWSLHSVQCRDSWRCAVQQKSEAEVEMATVRQEYETYKVSGLTANCV